MNLTYLQFRGLPAVSTSLTSLYSGRSAPFSQLSLPGVPQALNTCPHCCFLFVPVNNGLPTASCTAIQPTAHISLACVYSLLPNKSSGASSGSARLCGSFITVRVAVDEPFP